MSGRSCFLSMAETTTYGHSTPSPGLLWLRGLTHGRDRLGDSVLDCRNRLQVRKDGVEIFIRHVLECLDRHGRKNGPALAHALARPHGCSEILRCPVTEPRLLISHTSDNKGTKVQVTATEILDIIPTRTIRIPVDAEKVIASGTVKPEDKDKIVPYIDIKLKGNSILKSQLVVLDILAHNNWERPIYFVTGYHNDAFGLEEYFQLEGLAYRLVPIKSQNKSWIDYGRIDSDILYENMMDKFVWGGANDEKVNIDYNHKRTIIVVKARMNYARLAKALTEEGKNEKALAVLDRCMEVLPLENIPYDPYVADLVDAYYAAGNTDKAVEMTMAFSSYYYERLDYFLKQDPYFINSAEYEIQTAIQYTSRVAGSCEKYGKSELAKEINEKLEGYYAIYMTKLQPGAGLQ